MTKFIYMKLVGLLLVVLGFSYCLTSFSNFYAYLFGHTSLIAVIIGVVLIAISLGLIYYIRKTIKKLSLL